MKKLGLFLIVWLFFSLVLGTSIVSAQTIPANGAGDNTTVDLTDIEGFLDSLPEITPNISIYTDPAYPSPGDNISIYIQSYSLPVDEATISWYIDGKFISSGLGLKSINTTVGENARNINIKAVVKTSTGEYEVAHTVSPSELSILDEALTSTPPFYKGRALPVPGSIHKFIAISDFRNSAGRRIDDSNIVYTWRINGQTDGPASGTGRNVYIAVPKTEFTNPSTVTVTAKVVGQNLQNQAIENIGYSESRTLLYAKAPTNGLILSRLATGNMTLSGQEVEITALPLYFNLGNLGSLTYNWYLNNSRIETVGNTNSIILGRNSGESGQFTISAKILDKNNLYSSASSNLTLTYSANSSI
ncbi:MAG TPA: hypothetical protein P5328_00280 [Candidatus Paceibacterota bacterium]|nr:hypothetical protein [Candidatus Paceibacterota bacterium]HRZ34236.1 hypothetical protein [Candidatus Paceibacterota bacterium]